MRIVVDLSDDEVGVLHDMFVDYMDVDGNLPDSKESLYVKFQTAILDAKSEQMAETEE